MSNSDISKGIETVDAETKPMLVLNHSVGDDGVITHVAVFTSEGVPKDIQEINVVADSTSQLLDISAGDIMLKRTTEDTAITVIQKDADKSVPLTDLIDAEFLPVAIEFLNDFENHFFIIKDHNDTVNNISIDTVYARRLKLSELLEGIKGPLRDQLVNWIERSSLINPDDYSWDSAPGLPKSAPLYTHYNVSDEQTFFSSTMLIEFRVIGGAFVADTKQIPINPAEYLAGTNNGDVKVHRHDIYDEHVERSIIITQANDVVNRMQLFKAGNAPQAAYLFEEFLYDTIEDQDTGIYFQLIDKEDSDHIDWIARVDSSDEQWSLDPISHRINGEYVESGFVDADGNINICNIHNEEELSLLPDGAFTQPHYHKFVSVKTDDTKEKQVYITIVNEPDDLLKEE